MIPRCLKDDLRGLDTRRTFLSFMRLHLRYSLSAFSVKVDFGFHSSCIYPIEAFPFHFSPLINPRAIATRHILSRFVAHRQPTARSEPSLRDLDLLLHFAGSRSSFRDVRRGGLGLPDAEGGVRYRACELARMGQGIWGGRDLDGKWIGRAIFGGF